MHHRFALTPLPLPHSHLIRQLPLALPGMKGVQWTLLLGDQRGIPPSEASKLGVTPLLTGATEEWDHSRAKEPLHRVFILFRGIRGHHPGTCRSL